MPRPAITADPSRRPPGDAGKTRGLTLLELVVAVLVLAIAAISTYRVVDVSGQQIGQEAGRLMARTVAANRAAELRLATTVGYPGAPGRVRMGGQDLDVAVTTERTAGGLEQATITVRAASGGGAVLVTYLPARGTARP